ncbi:phospholipid carrier-dependent glycosyltransferase [Candidatus Daviesbacteria bacterium]|nr:phospholipid carrier-dependent glycosyltransferase [Candidatus Daviesbacteria bacterium]
MDKKGLVNWLFVAVVALAVVLRLYNLTQYPPGFTADEAAIGYNAYSLLQTGRDEYGTPWPLVFRSFDDYKPPLYFYLVLPFMAVLGPTELAVRLPSALLGIGTVVLVYFLAKRLAYSRQQIADSYMPLAASFLLAINPWHLHYSRGGWEANAGTFFLTLGIFLFVKFLADSQLATQGVPLRSYSSRGPLLLLIASVLSLIAAFYTYHSIRVVAPVLFALYAILFWRQLWPAKKAVIWAVMAGGALLIPLALQFVSGSGAARFAGVGIFADSGPFWQVNQARGEHANLTGIDARLFHNKVAAYTLSFAGHYLDHFTGQFLFFGGDAIGRNNVPEMGQLYVWEILTLIIGLWLAARQGGLPAKIVLPWLLIAPLAASLTFQTPHALRAANMAVPLAIISGYGLSVLLAWIWQIRRAAARYLLLLLTASCLLLAFVKYLHQYYVHISQERALEWQYGFDQLVPFVLAKQDQYNKVVITDRYDQPYILMLFYSKYDPAQYQPQAQLSSRDRFGFGTVRAFDKYEFRHITPDEVEKATNTLFVLSGDEVYEGVSVQKTIAFPNGKVAFAMVEK